MRFDPRDCEAQGHRPEDHEVMRADERAAYEEIDRMAHEAAEEPAPVTAYVGTDLEWLTDGRAVAAYRAGEGDVVVWDAQPGGSVARLTWDATDARMLVNGEDEEREDLMALLGVFDEVDEADLPPGQVCYLGTWN